MINKASTIASPFFKQLDHLLQDHRQYMDGHWIAACENSCTMLPFEQNFVARKPISVNLAALAAKLLISPLELQASCSPNTQTGKSCLEIQICAKSWFLDKNLFKSHLGHAPSNISSILVHLDGSQVVQTWNIWKIQDIEFEVALASFALENCSVQPAGKMRV